MKLPVALALVIGVLGAIITYLYFGPLAGLGLSLPATFLALASYFAAGGDQAALVKSLASNVWGIVLGTIGLIVLASASSPLMIGVIVGVLVIVLILGALVPVLGFVPGSVIGLVTTIGFGLTTTGAAGTDFSLPKGPFTVMLISFLIGAAYAWVSGLLAGKLVATEAANA